MRELIPVPKLGEQIALNFPPLMRMGRHGNAISSTRIEA